MEKPLGKFIEEFRKNSTVQDEYEVLTSARSGLVRQKDYYYDNDRITKRDNIGFNIIPPNYLTYRSRSDDRRFFFNENNLGITGIISIYYPVFRIVDGCNKFFVELTSIHSNTIGKYSVGSSQTVLSLNELKRIKLPLPTSAEQQKIADCLSSIDELITLQTQKLDTLKAHQKWLMQHLFPAEGETVPKLRFPEFREAAAWGKKRLGDIFQERVSKGFPEKTILAASQEIGIIPNHSLQRVVIRNRENLIGYKLVLPGDFVISLRSFEGGFEYSLYEGIISPAYVVIYPKTEIHHDFFCHHFKSSKFIKVIQLCLNNNLRDGKSISYKQAAELEIYVPKYSEQRRIADSLSSLDELLEEQANMLDKLKAHKNGIMQQLFPLVDEANG